MRDGLHSRSPADGSPRTRSTGEASGADQFVPGHGPIGRAADLVTLSAYLDDLERLAPTAGAVATPDRYRSWALRRFFAANLAFAAGPAGARGG